MNPLTPPPAVPTPVGTAGGERLRLLVVAPFAPRYDSPHGGRVTAQLLRRLTDRHDVALVYLRHGDEPPPNEELVSRLAVVREVMMAPPRIGHTWAHRLNVVVSPLLGRPTPVANNFSPALIRAVRRLATEWKPDVIELEHDTLAYCAPLLSGYGRTQLLVSHDPGLRAAAHLAKVTTGRQRLAHRLEARIWRRYWRATLPALNAVVVFTEKDLDVVRRVVSAAHVTAIPLGIDIPAQPLSAAGRDSSVVFVGSYAHLPNADAASRLIESIMPAVRATFPQRALVLVGNSPTAEMRAVAGPLDQITGHVPSIEGYVDRAALIALPIRIGGGMRVKLLEALAAGKAVVASPLAAAGLSVTGGEQLVLADSDEEFIAAIITLLDDDQRRRQLGAAARLWAEQNLGWDSRVSAYEDLYRALLGGKARSNPAAGTASASSLVGQLDQ